MGNTQLKPNHSNNATKTVVLFVGLCSSIAPSQSSTAKIKPVLLEEKMIDETAYLMNSKKTYETIKHSLKSKEGTTYNSLKDFARAYKIHV